MKLSEYPKGEYAGHNVVKTFTEIHLELEHYGDWENWPECLRNHEGGFHLIPAAVAESHDRERELMLAVVEAAKEAADTWAWSDPLGPKPEPQVVLKKGHEDAFSKLEEAVEAWEAAQ